MITKTLWDIPVFREKCSSLPQILANSVPNPFKNSIPITHNFKTSTRINQSKVPCLYFVAIHPDIRRCWQKIKGNRWDQKCHHVATKLEVTIGQ
jgi:hypothetical protein